MRSVCVVGSAGFVGSNITWKLFDADIDVIGVDNLEFGFEANMPKCVFYEEDFVEMSEHFWEMFDVVVVSYCSNLIYAMNNPIETIKNNAIKFYSFLEKYKGKIIYLSTSSVYGNADIYPTPETAEIKTSNAYDTSKRIAEIFLQQRGNYTTLRLSNVYGKYQRAENPYCGVIGKMIDAVMNNKPIEIYGDGTATRDYTHVSDVVRAVMLAIEQPSKNTEINIATGTKVSAKSLCRAIYRVIDKPVKYVNVMPRSIDAIKDRQLDIKKAELLLGWKPTITLNEGLKQTIDESINKSIGFIGLR